MSLPNELEKRQRISADLKRAINVLDQIDILESDLDDLANTLQDENVMKAKDFKAYVKTKYEGQKLLDKAKKKVAEVEENLAIVEILDKVKIS